MKDKPPKKLTWTQEGVKRTNYWPRSFDPPARTLMRIGGVGFVFFGEDFPYPPDFRGMK